MCEESREVVVELTVNDFQVMLEVGSEILDIVEYLLEIFLNHSKDARKFDVSKTRYYVIGYRMILISYQDGKLDIKALHKLRGLSSFADWGFTQADLPVTQESLHEKVEGDEEIDYLIISLLKASSISCLYLCLILFFFSSQFLS